MSTFRFYIHTSAVFPFPNSSPPSKEATKSWSLTPSIKSTLSLMTPTEQEAVIRFFHPGDASRCLSSLLLKHLAICHGVRVPWSKSTISQQRDVRNGKPYYAEGGVEFNVSHHGEYVICLGTTIPGARVGIDIAFVDLEKPFQKKGKTIEAVREWVAIFSDILNQDEMDEIADLAKTVGVEQGLRRFHTVWACKEAYIKLTSDALMAPWLKELEFPGLRVPEAAVSGRIWGDLVYTEIKLQGQLVTGTRIEIVGLGKDYIVASAIDRDVPFAAFEKTEVVENGSALRYTANGEERLCSLKE